MILQGILTPERRRTLRKLGRDLLILLVVVAGDWLLEHFADLGLPPAWRVAAYPMVLLVWRELRAALGKPATVVGS